MAIQHGMNQQTPAVQNVLKQLKVTAKRMKMPKTRKPKRSSAGSKRKTRSASSLKSSAKKLKQRFVKGSAQAKAYMAKIRKLRK